MIRRRPLLLGSALVLPLAALAHFGCVGDAPVAPTPTGDAGPDVVADVSNDVGADAATPLLACDPGETLETFDDPMGAPGAMNFCLQGVPAALTTCDAALTLGLDYTGGVLRAAATVATVDAGIAAANRAMDFGAVSLAAAVTFEVSIGSLVGSDAGTFSGLGCFIDLDNYFDGGGATISRTDLVTDDKGLFASTWTNTQIGRVGGTRKALPGFTRTDPMTVTISVDRRAVPTAKVAVSSSAGAGSVDMSPTAGSTVAISCGADRIGLGETKVSIRKIHYARCIKK